MKRWNVAVACCAWCALACSSQVQAATPARSTPAPGGQSTFGASAPAFGTADDSLPFQAALDAAERDGRPLELAPGTIVNLHGTVYLGNVTIHGRGATINVILDGSFQRHGSAQRATEGAILTKSAPGAGFGLTTVRIAFDELTINTVRTSDGPGPVTGLLLQNTDGFQGDVLRVSARGTGRSQVNPLDFFSGVQGVRVGTIVERMNNPGAHGGFWIRNFSPNRATADIDIGTIDAAGATGDELVSIFNSGSPDADLHDIHIGRIVARPSGGSGMAVSIYRNAGDYDPSKMQRISIGMIDATVGDIQGLADSTGGFAVKVQKAAPRIGAVNIAYVGNWTPRVPYVFGLRFAPGRTQREPLYVPSVAIRVDAHNRVPAGSAAMLYGPISTGHLVVRGAGSGFRQAIYGGGDLRGVDIQSSAFSDRARFTPPSGTGSR